MMILYNKLHKNSIIEGKKWKIKQGERENVVYDIQETDFNIPALSLQVLCGGQMEIHSTSGKGTVAVLRIPVLRER
ncbi:MAG: hypothetical protein EGS40_01825 [Agathobacter sp.]|nr:hypothetical protein [Agathobacter sp.]MBD9285984.1 hypothetical protein [Agathobacter sp.]